MPWKNRTFFGEKETFPRRRQNDSLNHVPVPLGRRETFRKQMLSKLNDFYIIEKLSKCKYLKWSCIFYLKLQAKIYHEKKSWKLKKD